MRLAVMTLVVLGLSESAFSQRAEGDRLWATRAAGHEGGRAQAAPIDATIAAYQKAIVQNPNDLESHWKLLRAIRFKGAYVAASNDEKKKVYGAAKQAGQETLALVGRLLEARGVKSMTKENEKKVAEAARAIPGADEALLWDAINWGEWALAYGKLAAVREGAADRIRRQATIANLIDPRLEGGTPARVLGRLHSETPSVPFVTGWASIRESVRFLNESLRVDPTSKITRVFLAEAMVELDARSKPQALEILRSVVSTPNNSEFPVEEAAAQADARILLAKWQ